MYIFRIISSPQTYKHILEPIKLMVHCFHHLCDSREKPKHSVWLSIKKVPSIYYFLTTEKRDRISQVIRKILRLGSEIHSSHWPPFTKIIRFTSQCHQFIEWPGGWWYGTRNYNQRCAILLHSWSVFFWMKGTITEVVLWATHRSVEKPLRYT